MSEPRPTPEHARLAEDASRALNWKRWGPYLAERQWATVREDYSPDGDCWNYFPHDHARSRAYRWGEDGLLGLTDRECRLCFAPALWNGRDPILKERLFGLAGPEGNHGEDVKEEYFYLDATPTYSYCKSLYRYPHAEFPYARLVEENRRRSRRDPEYELADTGVFEGDRYWDVTAEYAKASPDDLLVRLRVTNRGPEPATLHVLPTLWFRNTWSWSCPTEESRTRPSLEQGGDRTVFASHDTLGRFRWEFDDAPGGAPALLFTENESNRQRLWNAPNPTPYVKDAFHRHVIDGDLAATNPARTGTKAAAHYVLQTRPGVEITLRLRLRPADLTAPAFSDEFDRTFAARVEEADAYYDALLPPGASADPRNVSRQAYAGLLHSRQFYHYVVDHWLAGDPAQPPPPAQRRDGRNADWRHLFSRDVLSMPDKWEYPWFAAWDLAFHMIPMARVDPQFAKDQLLLLLREWYMHPNGQLPAYEFAFGDVNPPVHAWACWRVYKMTAPRGHRDTAFLARAFQKLLMNFTWWVNRKDVGGKHIFAGGFLGLDNIGLFDRSKPLDAGGTLEQADGTAWMAFYCSTMLSMALELAGADPAYEDIASKFFEHFVAIVDAMNTLGDNGLWDERDGFYYDQLKTPDGAIHPLRVRSMVGIIPLFACEVLEHQRVVSLPGFDKRTRWFMHHRKDLARHISYMECDKVPDDEKLYLLAVPSEDRLRRTLRYVLDEREFLSPFGVRSLSKYHLDHPLTFRQNGAEYRVEYSPAESPVDLFGGNSNWRGPVWMPVNYLLIEALERYHHFYGDDFKVECPTGSGNLLTLREVAAELSRRLTSLFLKNSQGLRPALDGISNPNSAIHTEGPRQRNPKSDHLLFHEYFDADTGRGLGASHQTGWTALVTRLIEKTAPSLPKRLRKGRDSARA